MSSTVTFRLDPETARILKELTRRSNSSKSRVIKEALRDRWSSIEVSSNPTAWEVYSKLDIPPARGPRHNHAREHSKLLRKILLAKRRAGTL
jgi:hypothetical protein